MDIASFVSFQKTSPRFQEAQSFEKYAQDSLNEKLAEKSNHPKGAFRAGITLQKFGYSVVGHMGA